MLTHILTYHVVLGQYDFAKLWTMIEKGETKLKTVSGGSLWIAPNGPHNIILKDEAGNAANITTYDVYQSNGVIHAIDAVLMPKM